MNFRELSSNVELGFELIGWIALLRGPNPESNITRLAQIIKPGMLSSVYVPVTDLLPAHLVMVWQDVAVCLIDGVTRLSQATAYADALDVDVNASTLGGVNDYVHRQAIAVAQTMVSAGVLRTSGMYIAGHSMGGAIAECIWVLLQRSTGGFPASVVTFGSPRPGWAPFCRLLDGCDLTRWMNDDDPVPCVPPRQTQARLWFAVISNRQRLNANGYVHPRGGIILRADGTVTAGDVPPIPDTGVQLSLAAWIDRSASNVETSHGAAAYYNRLFLRKQNVPPQAPPVGGSTHSGTPVQAPSNEMRRQADQTLRDVNAVARDGNATPVVIPPAQIFQAVSIHGEWCIEFGMVTFSVAGGRKRARAVAALGNRFLRRLQGLARVDIDALATQFIHYLLEASNPNSEFRPTMRT